MRFFTNVALASSVLFACSTALGEATKAQSVQGTIIGNAKFVEYTNEIYGVKLMYPEQWNLVDSGQSVNIVAYQAEGFAPQAVKEFEMPKSIDLFFDDRYTFPTFLAFERYVKSLDPQKTWVPTKFKGLFGFRSEGTTEASIALLRKDKSAMKISFPKEDGKIPVLVEETINSITLEKP